MSRLLAPIMPFLADELFENLVRSGDPGAPDSVHLTRFPWPREGSPESPASGDCTASSLREAMAGARALVALGRQARSSAALPVRQPLARALVTMPPPERDTFGLVR
jgi:isoleucyl-tRNA synthetase